MNNVHAAVLRCSAPQTEISIDVVRVRVYTNLYLFVVALCPYDVDVRFETEAKVVTYVTATLTGVAALAQSQCYIRERLTNLLRADEVAI